MPFYAGKLGSITIDGDTNPLTDWSIDLKSEAIESTNFTSAGWQENEAGIASADISANGPLGGISGEPGDAVVFVLSTGGATPGPSFTVTARITSIKVDTSVKGIAMVSYTATSTGAVT